MTATGTMLWKEVRELYLGGGRPVVRLAIGLSFTALLGAGITVVMAFTFTEDHRLAYALTAGLALAALTTFSGFMGPMATVVDAFAGERERHTLETLLAGPLSDRAILAGKVLAQYVPLVLTAATLGVVGSLVATLMAGAVGLLVLPITLGGGLVGGTVTSSLVIALGTLISLRAPTVKKGQETLSYYMLPILLLPGLAVAIGPRVAASASDAELLRWALLGAIAMPAVVFVLAIILMVVLFRRFRRDALIGR